VADPKKHWVPGTGCPALGARHWVPGTGGPALGARHWVPGTGCPALGARHWVPGTGFCFGAKTCGIVVLSDFNFNHLNIQDLVISHTQQVVRRPTRQDSILDYIITTLKSFYKTPDISAPLGTSDHNVIMWIPRHF
jgi:hypothetical protein